MGHQGLSDLRSVEHETIVALCDVYVKRAGNKINRYSQAKVFRKMLEEMDKEIDAAFVVTP